jgi:hypothetical protein
MDLRGLTPRRMVDKLRITKEDMIDALSATKGASAPHGAASEVFRTELNPVDFLRRAAYV